MGNMLGVWDGCNDGADDGAVSTVIVMLPNAEATLVLVSPPVSIPMVALSGGAKSTPDALSVETTSISATNVPSRPSALSNIRSRIKSSSTTSRENGVSRGGSVVLIV